jgi:hypothetical protein
MRRGRVSEFAAGDQFLADASQRQLIQRLESMGTGVPEVEKPLRGVGRSRHDLLGYHSRVGPVSEGQQKEDNWPRAYLSIG